MQDMIGGGMPKKAKNPKNDSKSPTDACIMLSPIKFTAF
jgi:hypothetical protein